jgi:transcriptional regulator of acetoin/glycerol metabolism
MQLIRLKGSDMKILLTFTGVHDPFAEISGAGEKMAGPVLTVSSARQFDCVHLFSTPATAANATQTKEELQKRNNSLTVEICDVPLKDPANRLGIPKQLKSRFKKLCKKNPQAEYFICVSSGIPHVDASWLMLAARGEIHARILQARTPKFVRAGPGRVTEIDFTNLHAPQIRPFGAMPETDGPCDFQSLSDDLCLVGDHALFLRELKTAFSMAESDCPILLLGETNTGKEAFARLIHCASKRAAKPFITVNCAAVTETPIESRLFGHAKDAFTGAGQDHKGCFEQADGGTVFLDELDGLPAPCQAKLLRAMEHGKIQRLGDDRESSVNVRVIAATRVDINDVIAEKQPRKDLYQSFYLLRFSAKTKKKWDRLLRAQSPALPEETPAQTNIVPLPSAAGR